MRNCDMILGLPWLRDVNPVVNWAEDIFAFRAGGEGSFNIPIRAKKLKGSGPAPIPEAAAIPQSLEGEDRAESKQKDHVEDSTHKTLVSRRQALEWARRRDSGFSRKSERTLCVALCTVSCCPTSLAFPDAMITSQRRTPGKTRFRNVRVLKKRSSIILAGCVLLHSNT